MRNRAGSATKAGSIAIRATADKPSIRHRLRVSGAPIRARLCAYSGNFMQYWLIDTHPGLCFLNGTAARKAALRFSLCFAILPLFYAFQLCSGDVLRDSVCFDR